MNNRQRIQSLDALRGIAVLGIFLMNILWFGMPEQAVEDLRVRGEFSGPNYWCWWIIEVFFHGTMRGMFSLLFGASAILILEQSAFKTSLDSAAEFFSRRLVVLFVFGLINAYLLLWPGDILYTYALAGMFIMPFYRLPVKKLLIIAGFVMVLFSIKQSWSKQKPVRMKAAADIALTADTTLAPLSAAQKADIETWQSFEHEHRVEHKRMVDEDQIACTQGDFWTFFSYSASISYFLETDFVYNFFFLDAFSFMLIGMALYRLGVLTGKRSKQFYLFMSLIGFLIGLPIYYLAASAKVTYGFDPYALAMNQPLVLEQFGRLGLTLGYVGLLNLLFQLPLTSWLTLLLSPVGRLAFTNYLMQSIIGGLLFSGFAFGLFNKLERFELYYVVGALWVFQLVFSHVYVRRFTIGPFEWLWRSATLGKWQKIERVKR